MKRSNQLEVQKEWYGLGLSTDKSLSFSIEKSEK